MGKIFPTMLLYRFDIQHDHILKKLNIGLCLHPLSLICFIFVASLSACEISVKNIDNRVIAKFKYLTFDLT